MTDGIKRRKMEHPTEIYMILSQMKQPILLAIVKDPNRSLNLEDSSLAAAGAAIQAILLQNNTFAIVELVRLIELYFPEDSGIASNLRTFLWKRCLEDLRSI
jgi:hypothetical protein